VSERYAWEVAQPWAEEGVQDLIALRGDRFRGILNGIDYDVWNPAKDAVVVANYSPGKMAGKAACKKHLQEIAGLQVDPDRPLIGMVSRLDALKGFDLIIPALNDLRDAQFVFLGSGDPVYAAALNAAAAVRDDVSVFLQFNSDLARQVYAGADMLLMPSRREPSGTSQMIALKFGAIPIVHMTGGLADTISEELEDQNGFVFRSYNVDDFIAAVRRACAAYRDPVAWSALVDRAMACDFSWDRSARKYIEMYEAALALGRDRD
jgi:starch synthase